LRTQDVTFIFIVK